MIFGYSLLNLVDEKQGGNFVEKLPVLRKEFAQSMGMVFPSVRLRNDPILTPNKYIIKIKGEEVASAELLADHLLALDDGEVTRQIPAIDTIEPSFGLPARWISEDKKPMAEAAGYTLIDPTTVMLTHFGEVIKRFAHEILTRQDVQTMVDNLKAINATLVEEIVPKQVSLGLLQKILCRLLQEGIPIRNLDTILETLSANIKSVANLDLMVEFVRSALKRTITHKYAEGGELRYIALDPNVENKIREIFTAGDGKTFEPGPDFEREIITKSIEQADNIRTLVNNVIILTSPGIRIIFKRMIENFIPDAVILSNAEIEPDIVMHAIGNISF